MYSSILIATDGSELAENALEQGLELARRLGSSVTVVTVIEPVAVVGAGYSAAAGLGYSPVPELIEAQREQAMITLEAAQAKARDAGMTVRIKLITEAYAAEGIVAAAEEIGADLIVMGSHGRRGLGRLLVGSQTSNVLAHTKIPVLVTR